MKIEIQHPKIFLILISLLNASFLIGNSVAESIVKTISYTLVLFIILFASKIKITN